jgi:hypothetical protein
LGLRSLSLKKWDKESISNLAQDSYEAIGELSEKNEDEEWNDFLWKLTAFDCIQDIFEINIYESDNLELLSQQYYFYYESKAVFAESILAGLNGLYIASNSLLRLFLEFNILQNYYRRQIVTNNNYSELREYFKRGIHPRWSTAIKRSMSTNAVSKKLNVRILRVLKSLSKNTQHPYHPDFSQGQHRTTKVGHSMNGLLFWKNNRITLDAVLKMYFINYPMLFNPVDVLRKFGFNPPVGVAVDRYVGEIIKKSMIEREYNNYKDISMKQENALEIMEWISQRNDLTDEEIKESWSDPQDEKPNDIISGYLKQLSKIRALREALAFRPSIKHEQYIGGN